MNLITDLKLVNLLRLCSKKNKENEGSAWETLVLTSWNLFLCKNGRRRRQNFNTKVEENFTFLSRLRLKTKILRRLSSKNRPSTIENKGSHL